MTKKSVLPLLLVLFAAFVILAPQSALAAAEKAVEPIKAGAEKAATKKAANVLSGPVNINTASAEELAKLPGIGPKIAEDIVKYRKENGDFKTTKDITKVKGVGDKKYESIKDKITVGQ
jgi:competence protein ComEA